jgi:hypothetical protein
MLLSPYLVDDIVVTSRKGNDLISNVEETFTNL